MRDSMFQVYTVAEVTSELRELLQSHPVFSDVWIRGEVSNLSVSQAGHCYFTLKDERSALRCVLFRRPSVAMLLENGAAIVAHGRISIYEVRGELQFYVDLVQPEGKGLLQLQYELLKTKLEDEGLFDAARKRPLPAFPRRIGVVTSPTGAVFHDIVNVLMRRYPLVEVVLAPTLVQGEGSADNIVSALEAVNRSDGIDVIILARGGGSLEELWAFNEEQVARAVYASRVPVISGVGHETDWTIADLVADVRAPTPSVAAEVAVPNQAELCSTLLERRQTLLLALRHETWQRRQRLEQSAQRVQHLAPDLAQRRHRLDELGQSAITHLRHRILLHRERLKGHLRQLDSLNPRHTLERGYAIVQRLPGYEVVTSVAQVQRNDRFQVRVSDGAFDGRVTRKPTRRGVQGSLL